MTRPSPVKSLRFITALLILGGISDGVGLIGVLGDAPWAIPAVLVGFGSTATAVFWLMRDYPRSSQLVGLTLAVPALLVAAAALALGLFVF